MDEAWAALRRAEWAAARVLAGYCRSLGEALDAFRRQRMSLEEGRVQLALARLEEGERALLGARGALATFERLGAARDADEAAAPLRELGVSGRSAPRLGGELTARAGGPGPARRGPLQPRDRRPALHQPEDRRAPRRAHPRQARRALARRGRRARRPRRTNSSE